MTTAPIAVTCGEPAGVGPEIAVAAWQALKGSVPLVWIGDPRHLPEGTPIFEVDTPHQAIAACSDALPVLSHAFPSLAQAGEPDLLNAHGVIDVIRTAVSLAQKGEVRAICTAPIHKKVLKDGAEFAWPGHTEFLAHLGGVDDVVMMLASDQLRVVPATIHIALADVAHQLTESALRRTIEITADGLRRDFGIAHPRLVVAGLNPHAGEGGAMGCEEVNWINALVADMAAGDLDITGPRSADTMFHPAARDTYDAAICMYHDQALIPIKTLDFDRGVNVTLGLPIVRTSPDHGTAFDIAGTGQADPTSTIEALRLAWSLAQAQCAQRAT